MSSFLIRGGFRHSADIRPTSSFFFTSEGDYRPCATRRLINNVESVKWMQLCNILLIPKINVSITNLLGQHCKCKIFPYCYYYYYYYRKLSVNYNSFTTYFSIILRYDTLLSNRTEFWTRENPRNENWFRVAQLCSNNTRSSRKSS